MRSFVLVAGLAVGLAVFPAIAQAPQGMPTNVRGKIVKVSGQTLTVKTRDGKTADIALAPNAAVRSLVRKHLSDIHDGDYIASSSMRGKDGKLHAIEVHFLPPAVPELQAPWDLRDGSVMTNAHVSGIVKMKSGSDISLTYKGTPTDVVIDRKTVIVAPADAAMSDLKPGKAVFVRAIKGADGNLSANNVTVEKNGIKPPM